MKSLATTNCLNVLKWDIDLHRWTWKRCHGILLKKSLSLTHAKHTNSCMKWTVINWIRNQVKSKMWTCGNWKTWPRKIESAKSSCEALDEFSHTLFENDRHISKMLNERCIINEKLSKGKCQRPKALNAFASMNASDYRKLCAHFQYNITFRCLSFNAFKNERKHTNCANYFFRLFHWQT